MLPNILFVNFDCRILRRMLTIPPYQRGHLSPLVRYGISLCLWNQYLHILQVCLILLAVTFKQFYVKTGKCKFGATCKFHHPKDIQLPSAGQDNGSDAHVETAISNDGNTGELKLTQPLFIPALLHKSKVLPIRLVIYL